MTSLLGKILDKAPVSFAPPAPRSSSLFGSNPQRSSRTTELGTTQSVGTLWAIVNALSEGTAQAEWKLYRTSRPGKTEAERVEVGDHLALRVWNKPNRFYTRQEFVQTFQQHVDLTGEGWWVVGRDSRATFPMELWPVRPDRMDPVPHPTDFLSGYVYTGPEGEKVPLKLDEVVQLRLPNPLDPYRGLGPVQSILADIDSTRYSAEWNRNFFLNSAEPGGVIEIPETLSDSQFQTMRARWNEQHKGVANSHRVAILENGKWVDRKYTQRDMQFTELRDVSREIIREAFRFPKPMLGSVDDVNRANADAAELVFARWCIKPRLERIKQALNNDFLPMFGSTGQGVEFDYCLDLPEDEETEANALTSRATAVKTLIDAGFDPTAALAVVGLPDMPVRSTPQQEVTV